MAYRIDRGEAQGHRKTEDGFLMVKGRATRCGVLRYRNPDGTYRYELRHPDDVINPLSLNTLAGVPLTIEHPPALLNPQNVGQYQVGAISNRVEATDDGFVEVVINVHRGDAIDYLEQGRKRMLSCGYRCDVAEEQGEYNGQRYTHRQRNIRYNHVCLTDDGRAGETVRVVMDSLGAEAADLAVEDPVPTVDHTNWTYYTGDAMGTQTLKVKPPTSPDESMVMDMDDMPMGLKTKVISQDGSRKYQVTLDMGDYEEELEVEKEAFDTFKKAYDSMQSALSMMKKEGFRKDSLIVELESDLNSYTQDLERKDSLISDLEAEIDELRKVNAALEEHFDSKLAEVLSTFDADDLEDDDEMDLELMGDDEGWEKDADDDDLDINLNLNLEEEEEEEEDDEYMRDADDEYEMYESDADDEYEMYESDADDEYEMYESDAEEEEEYEDEDEESRIDSLVSARYDSYQEFQRFLESERFDARVPAEEWLHRAAAKQFALNGTESEAELRGMLRALEFRTDSGDQQLQELSSLISLTSRADSATSAREAMIRRELERTHSN